MDPPDAEVSLQQDNGVREAILYGSAFAKDPTVSSLLAEVIYAYGSYMLAEYVVVMQDITAVEGGATGVNMVFGNQVRFHRLVFFAFLFFSEAEAVGGLSLFVVVGLLAVGCVPLNLGCRSCDTAS